MEQQHSIQIRWFLRFVLWTVISFGILNNGMGFAQDQNKDTAADKIESVTQDLDDFFKEDSGQIPADDDSNDLDGFFNDDDTPADMENVHDSQTSFDEPDYFIDGSVEIKTGYRFNRDAPLQGETDHRGVSDLKAEMELEYGRKIFESWDFFVSGSAFYNLIFDINDQADYTDQYINENEKEVELDKLFIRGSLSKSMDLKIGRQIVVWGKSDNIRVTDVLNPLDLREPGMTDIEDLRLPVTMTRMDYYLSSISFAAYIIHEHRSHTLPVFGSPYYYLSYPLPNDTDPSTSLENTEFAMSLSGTFPGMDMSFYIADIYDDIAFLNGNNQRVHERIFMSGFALNLARGDFLYKTEAAVFDGIRLSAFPQAGAWVENSHDYTRIDALIGVEYYGFDDTNISFEVADRWLTNYNSDAEKSGHQEHTVQYAVRASKTFMHDILELTLVASLYGETADDGGFIRTQGEYDVTDAISFTLGAILYKSGSDRMFRHIGENDAVFSSITYSF